VSDLNIGMSGKAQLSGNEKVLIYPFDTSSNLGV